MLMFHPLFANEAKKTAETMAELALGCSEPGYFLSHRNDTCLLCTFSPTSKFVVTDLNSAFAKTAATYAKLSLSESLQAQLQSMVPSNMTQSFGDGALLSIIYLSIPFGLAVAILPRNMKLIASCFEKMNVLLMNTITWVIITPIAIVSLPAKSISSQKDLGVLVSDVGFYVLCVAVTLLFHVLVFYPIVHRILVEANPYTWLRKMVKAQIFALSCASSMATLLITMECIEKIEVSATIYRFVTALGATINMDGTAIYFPISIVFMTEAGGIGNLIGGVEMFLIILVSTAPVPSIGIVTTMPISQGILPSQPLPANFANIVATDWTLDRFKTCVHVTGDTVVTRIVAESVGTSIDLNERASVASALDEYATNKRELRDAIDAHGDATPRATA